MSKRRSIIIRGTARNVKAKKTGAFALIDTLVRNNTRYIFGYPGGAILPIYDELFFWESRNAIQHILTRHEQGAIHAADSYARVSGQIGVCFATSGPGATNLITGIANAQLDSIPLLVITGQVNTNFLGTDAYDIDGSTQEIPSIILVDNEATIRMSKNYRITKKNRHIRRRWHFVRYGVQEDLFRLEWVPGDDQLADDCTKTQAASKSKPSFDRTLVKIPDRVKGHKSTTIGNR